MLKEKAVASLGQQSLLLPAWIKAALSANDRLKLYLSLLQAAEEHAHSPESAVSDWSRELAQSGFHDTRWLHELVKGAYFDEGALFVPRLGELLRSLATDLCIMARPVCESGRDEEAEFSRRRDHWLQRMHEMEEEESLDGAELSDLTHGDRKSGDSFHLLVMDLHRRLNAMSREMATEVLDGAHVWHIEPADRPLVRAFMRGLNRTAPLKFSHPGLDTAVTRDGSRLLIQNDIGTNDVHVLVMEVEARRLSLTYSDLHAGRFDFFRSMLEEIGCAWAVFDPQVSKGLNAGKPYQVGKATFQAEDDDSLQRALEAIASRIVFVIDWNRARKRLKLFVRNRQAQHLLRQAAKHEWGHMGWLIAGADRLVYEAMQSVDGEAFRVGDRLDEVLSETASCEYLLELMRISSDTLRQQQPVSLVADEARMLLARVLRQRTFEFDLMAEHAAYCHALAQGLLDALDNEAMPDAAASEALVLRCKSWERQADHQLMSARNRAERQSRWLPVVELLSKADDVADALEEANFIHSMMLIRPDAILPPEVREALRRLADTTLSAIQDLVRAIEIGRHVSKQVDPADAESFLQSLWRMLRAERICDELLRQARRLIFQSLHDSPAELYLANDLAGTMEKATDSLLAAGYALRQMVFSKAGASA